MEPFSPQDPISKLLDRSGPIEPRGNFTQNVLREARQTPQDRGWLAAFRAWMTESPSAVPAFRMTAAAAIVTICAIAWWNNPGAAGLPLPSAPTVAEAPTAPVVTPEPAPTQVATVEESAVLDEVPLLPEVEMQWQNLDHLDALLAVEDTSVLSDRQIAFFLY